MSGDTQNWTDVEQHLKTCEAAYAEIGTAGTFVMQVILRPLRDRFNKNERTRELAEEIMAVNL
jgi:hypothetical protein